MNKRVLILGGYGHFGARIAHALADDPNIQLVVAGRHIGKAKAIFGGRPAGSRMIEFCELDLWADNFLKRLKTLAVDVLVHTAGPFQGQGYVVAEICIELGINYIDLADGRDFVCNFASRLDALVKARNCIAISGASTLPALSSAVVDELALRLDRLDEIQIVIAPAQRTPLGLATLRGVLSYCGARFDWWQSGSWKRTTGWMQRTPVTFAGLKPRQAAPCDVPDHELFVHRYPGVQTVQFRAALELPVFQIALSFLSAVRLTGIPLRVDKLAPLVERFARLFDGWGSDSGGMYIMLRGRKNGNLHEVRWDLTAPQLHGPEIPCMAAILLVRKIASSSIQFRGVSPCMGFLTLTDFASEFEKWNISIEISERNFSETESLSDANPSLSHP
jgi:saccharopine dehydrogenase-like NADP-dependent oxidoreductase